MEETDWLVIPCAEDSGCSLMTRARFSHRVAGYLSIAAYTYSALQYLRPYREKIRATHSSIEDLELNWLRWLLLFFFGAACLGILAEIQLIAWGSFLLAPGQVIALFPLLISILLGIFGTKQKAIHFEMDIDPKPQQDKPTPQKKYQTSSLGQDDAARLWQRLQQLMNDGRPYLENGLKISDLAKRLEVSVSHLSETINGHAGQSFYEFINYHRVEEAARMLGSSDLDYLSISDIGYQSGFNSNSAFFEHFKKLKGFTPNQYRKQAREM
ncbi:helix-turn-helix domain-containing protein [Pseudoteredinibacter isoporae]|uniref:helix-turn-helix domain-containing protein n=1 Tax=Pseudoteredinibacter isoporae TaxID=570281 RepID=UPI00161F90EE|nr:AraC family transcriptional regulator [Pseudoteredinibacter isoporae]